MNDANSVAIIGGGYAGFAAAVKLAESGLQSTVFEAAKILGGRARRIEYRDTTLDNGQHILSGAYTELLRMMALVGVPDAAFERVPLTLNIPPLFSLSAPHLPAPFHMAAALLTARGLSMGERFAAIRFMQALKKTNFNVDPTLSVQALLEQHRQPAKLVQYLWQPLTISALNTPLETASAQVLANVLRDALSASRSASDLILPKVNLSQLFPEPASNWLHEQGSVTKHSARVSAIEKNARGFSITYAAQNETKIESFSAVIIAVAPHQLGIFSSSDAAINALFSNATSHFKYEPITTIYLAFPVHSMPLATPMLGRVNTDGATGNIEGNIKANTVQWFFDREALNGETGLYAGVVSASGPHEDLSLDDLAKIALKELRESIPDLPEPMWHKVVHEKRATFACTPNLVRPSARTPVPRLALAGDYVACDYPATLEAAVRNGCLAAEIITADLQT